jgi:hypothetical protein
LGSPEDHKQAFSVPLISGKIVKISVEQSPVVPFALGFKVEQRGFHSHTTGAEACHQLSLAEFSDF